MFKMKALRESFVEWQDSSLAFAIYLLTIQCIALDSYKMEASLAHFAPRLVFFILVWSCSH